MSAAIHVPTAESSSEIRALGATTLVNNETELRAAIKEADSGDTITLKNSIDITKSELSITKDITLTSAGEDRHTLKQTEIENETGVIKVVAASLTLHNIVITGGTAHDGGGIYASNNATVYLTGATQVKDNHANAAFGAGGGIYADNSTVYVQDEAEICNNTAFNGGGIYAFGSSSVYLSGSASVHDNKFAHEGGGISVVTKKDAGPYAYASVSVSEYAKIYNNKTSTTYQTDGGGIFADSATVKIEGSVEIYGNECYRGGGIFVEALYSEDYDHNILNISGPVQIRGNIATYGGGINAHGGYRVTLEADNADVSPEVSGNKAILDQNGNVGYGGGILIHDHATGYPSITAKYAITVNISGSTKVTGNTAVGSGGGIRSDGDALSTVSISDSVEISGNSAGIRGGGIYAASNSTVALAGSAQVSGNILTATGGTVYGYGGGIYAAGSSSVTLADSAQVSGNALAENGSSVAHYGGGIYAASSSVTLTDAAQVSDNEAYWYGGGIYVYNTTATLTGSAQVSGNEISSSAGYGGGIYAYYATVALGDDADEIDDSPVISGNIAKIRGGGIYAYYGSAVKLAGSAQVRSNVTTNGGGGGIYADYWSSVTLADNSVVGGATADDGNSASTGGGGIYADQDSSVTLAGSAALNGNSAAWGGGIYVVDSGSTITLSDDARVSNNTASGNSGGGGIYVSYYASLSILAGSEASFSGNNATKLYYPDTTPVGFAGTVTSISPAWLETDSLKFKNLVFNNYDINYTGGTLTYTVTYDANGATSGTAPVDPTPYSADNAQATVLGNTGNLALGTYTFAGWNTAKDGKGTPYAANETFTVSGNITLYAQWALNTFTVRFLDFDGTELKSETVSYGSDATAPSDPTREGYTFTGWDKDFTNVTTDIDIKALYALIATDNPEPEPDPTVPAVVDTPTPAPAELLAEGFAPEEVEALQSQTGNPVVDLAEGNVPLGNLDTTLVISLLNLILAVLAALGSLVLLAANLLRRRHFKGAILLTGIAAVVLGLITVVVWLVLDGLNRPTAWLDAYTPIIVALFALFAIMGIIHTVVALRKTKDDDGDKNQDNRAVVTA
jgi:predicted outer membrane repeat protein